MRGPAPGVVGDQLPGAGHLNPFQVGDHLGRGLVGRPPGDLLAAQHAAVRHVRPSGDPLGDLGIAVPRRGERPPGQDLLLVVAVVPLDQTLGLRVGGNDSAAPRFPTCRGTPRRLRQHRLAAPPRPDRTFLIPDQLPGDRPEPAQQQPASDRRSDPPQSGSGSPTRRAPASSPQSSPAPAGNRPPMPQRDVGRAEPQGVLHPLTRQTRRPRGRVPLG